ncbi:Inward rectifier potassium channel [Blomia tropicalis]|nr:Inward rectifier potassium channel [Blomia tropicalis]
MVNYEEIPLTEPLTEGNNESKKRTKSNESINFKSKSSQCLFTSCRRTDEINNNNKEQNDLNDNGGFITPSIVRRLPALRRESKFFPGRMRKRVILKNGNVNLNPEHVDKMHRRYLQDMFTTMVDIRWRWNLLVFTMGFLLSWFSFAVVWWLIAFSHNDFEHLTDSEWTPCINNLNSFASAILFSIETQHTIGYGSRFTNEECPEAMFVMCLQSIVGVMIQCFMVGFVFAKLSRPQKRSQTLMFSRHAVTCLRDGRLCIMFRVGDLRDKSHIIGANITAQMISRKITEEGEVIPYYHQALPLSFDGSGTNLFLVWPAIIVHEIDENSPLYTMNCEAMMREKFEIVVILEGTVESTGQSVQARTSYLPSEILWGHRFEQMIRYQNDVGEFFVDYSKFNNTFPTDLPTYSAKEFQDDLLHRERQIYPNDDEQDETKLDNGNVFRYHNRHRPSCPEPTLSSSTAPPIVGFQL